MNHKIARKHQLNDISSGVMLCPIGAAWIRLKLMITEITAKMMVHFMFIRYVVFFSKMGLIGSLWLGTSTTV